MAAHIHSGDECDYTDSSTDLGHWNPTDEAHVNWGVEKHHSGDLGNIYLNSSGNGELVVLDKKKRGSLEKQPKKAWLVKQQLYTLVMMMAKHNQLVTQGQELDVVKLGMAISVNNPRKTEDICILYILF